MATTTTESLRQAAGQLLAESKVGVVIVYGRDNGTPSASAACCRRPEEADRLLFDAFCFPNLAVYFSKKEVRDLAAASPSKKIGLVVKGCDLRAVNVLLREHVIERGGLILIGVRCPGVGDPLLAKCEACDVREPQGCDIVVGEPSPAAPVQGRYAAAEAIDALPLDQRWAYWQKQLAL